MDRKEIEEFIRKMDMIGDHWEPEDVESVFGDCTLKEALAARKKEVGSFMDIISTVINR